MAVATINSELSKNWKNAVINFLVIYQKNVNPPCARKKNKGLNLKTWLRLSYAQNSKFKVTSATVHGNSLSLIGMKMF